jgi:hypothetical protein
MKKYYLIILLLCNLLTGKLLFAQNLGYNQGDYLEIGSRAGFTNNDFKNKLWLYRWINGSGWTRISIDVSCLVPGVDARTWWKRDPAGEIQSWGTRNETYMTLNGPRLGLGTTDPKTLLDIQSNQNGWMMSSRVNAVSAGEINGLKFYSGYLGDDKWAGIASISESLHSNKTGLALYSGMTERVRISGDGNVGISTSAPRAVLDVAKYVGFGSLGIVLSRMGEGDENGDGTYLGVKGYETQFSAYNGKTFALEHSFYGETNSSVSFYRGSSQIGGFMTFSTNNNKEQMRIDSWGNIGIGITNPTERLTVSGKIKANEIRVDGNGQPDYVFEEGYKISSLKETEQYIKLNKHLPEIPSAADAAKNGIALGEMNKLLLKKIEELTLHLIEKDKQYGELLNDVKKQEERLRLLEKKLDK